MKPGREQRRRCPVAAVAMTRALLAVAPPASAVLLARQAADCVAPAAEGGSAREYPERAAAAVLVEPSATAVVYEAVLSEAVGLMAAAHVVREVVLEVCRAHSDQVLAVVVAVPPRPRRLHRVRLATNRDRSTRHYVLSADSTQTRGLGRDMERCLASTWPMKHQLGDSNHHQRMRSNAVPKGSRGSAVRNRRTR